MQVEAKVHASLTSHLLESELWTDSNVTDHVTRYNVWRDSLVRNLNLDKTLHGFTTPKFLASLLDQS